MEPAFAVHLRLGWVKVGPEAKAASRAEFGLQPTKSGEQFAAFDWLFSHEIDPCEVEMLAARGSVRAAISARRAPTGHSLDWADLRNDMLANELQHRHGIVPQLPRRNGERSAGTGRSQAGIAARQLPNWHYIDDTIAREMRFELGEVGSVLWVRCQPAFEGGMVLCRAERLGHCFDPLWGKLPNREPRCSQRDDQQQKKPPAPHRA